jgi:Raf kinase inhibitor-like YbhB/YbcL family protein
MSAIFASVGRRFLAYLLGLSALGVAVSASAAQGLQLTSSAFRDGDQIPRRFTCQGEGVSPPLSWSGIPDRAKTLALIVEDPDAPDPAAPQTTWKHWVLYDIPADVSHLPAGASPRDLPPGARQGINDWHRTGYGAVCPPVGRHRYFFKLYALDTRLPNLHRPTKAELQETMLGHIVAEAELMGTYQKGQ